MSKIENVTINEGQDAQFVCKFISNPAPSNIVWFKNEFEEISPNDDQTITNNESSTILNIKGCKSIDTGSLFSVKVINQFGETVSNKASLIVNSGPFFVSEPQDQKVLKDKEARFECVIKSNPKPNIIWLLNGKELTTKDGVKIEKDTSKDKYTLIFPKVLATHVGSITVKATNEYGTIEKSCVLEAMDTPKIINKLDNITVNEGEQAKFTLKISGKPKPAVKWFKDDVEIELNETIEIVENEENEMTLIIKSCKSPENAGNYSAKIFNEFGEVSSNKAILTINSNSF